MSSADLFLFFLSLTLSLPSLSLSSSSSSDAMSLLAFKSSLSAPSPLLSTWNTSAYYCNWYGITCISTSRRVISINISGDSSEFLSGALSPSIGNLSELRVLSLPHNAFSGEIPASISELQYLEVLELQDNNFSGKVPDVNSNLSLRLLNLSYNVLSGSIPSDLIGFGRLAFVDLSNNRFTGGISIGRNSDCRFLRYLKLSNNFLDENIPGEIGKCVNLKALLLDGNIFEGRIPPEIGQLKELRVLDVSRNSLTDRIPRELSNCGKLRVVVLTDLVDFGSSEGGLMDFRGEFNAFVGGVPYEVFSMPGLEILWAPRANFGGRLPGNWSDSCSLRLLNLGQNYITGVIPDGLRMCRNLTFLDLSSNDLSGYLPSGLQVSCMVYFNISRNNLTGVLPASWQGSCDASMLIHAYEMDVLSVENNIPGGYSLLPVLASWMGKLFGSSISDDNFVVIHDFSWNGFGGSLSLFMFGNEFVATDIRSSYRLLLNNNKFDSSFHGNLVSNCSNLRSFSVNLSENQITSEIHLVLPLDCATIIEFEAAHNQISGSIPPSTGDLRMLRILDLQGNSLSGPLPGQLGKLKNLEAILLGGNNLTGNIPSELGQLISLKTLDLSQNGLTASIPTSLPNASNLETILLDHNRLSGEIPPSLSTLPDLTKLNLSFNNFSGHIPHFLFQLDCDSFKGNSYLHSCPELYSSPPAGLPVPSEVRRSHRQGKLKPLIVALVVSASIVLSILLVVTAFIVIFGKKKLVRLSSLRRKVVVTFADAPSELNYEGVIRATDNFSLRNLIGTGGFGSTYKAELVPGFLVAIKRLSVGRFQGAQQFEAEIRTLGRVRHKNLVTLIGYYVGEAEMFLIYNYLSGGNLETFIHERSGENIEWPVIHKIALDVAQALAYLHYSCNPKIVHRDIKPSNILLDKELNAYLSDFGLAKLLEVSETHATTDVAGTFGYVAPEYATTCRVSDKSDVYSFGVVLLELMSGKKSLDPSFSEFGNGFNIVAWAKYLIKEGRSSELFSPELWETGPKDNMLSMLSLAAICTSESLSVRPSMKQVVEKLKQLRP